MAARCAHEASRWVSLQPPLAFAPVPDAILWAEHPAPPFAVQDREVADREPERSGLKAPVATLIDQQPITRLGVSKRIDSHAESIARRRARVQGPRLSGCRIR
jgi:hypothetical protein